MLHICRQLNGHSKKLAQLFEIGNKTSAVAFSSNIVKPKIQLLQNGPGLKEFLIAGKNLPNPKLPQQSPDGGVITSSVPPPPHPYLLNENYLNGNGRRIFFEVYGCQMNVSDTEVVWAILKKFHYKKCDDINEADVIMLITCAIREGAETKIWNRLKHIGVMKNKRRSRNSYGDLIGPLQVAVLGCMAERIKTDLLEKERWVDVIAGPDSYQDLPRLLAITKTGDQSAVNVLLSLEETYADVMPVRLNQESKTAFVSIMRGCDNMCSYCIVPFTRGRERSRPIDSIIQEVQHLINTTENQLPIKEITLLGQNVNSYRDLTVDPMRQRPTPPLATGFRTVYKSKLGGARFAELLELVAETAPQTRIRFTSPHPKDFPDEVLKVIATYPNICKQIHLPAQSGNTQVLDRMRRGYTREAYLELVERIREILPNVSLSSDFICGFCGETDSEFQDTLSLMDTVKYNVAYLFAYSMREKTTAHRRFLDDVPNEVKNLRLREMIRVFRENATEVNRQFIGKEQTILIEGVSKRLSTELWGRNDANIKVIIPIISLPIVDDQFNDGIKKSKFISPGDFVRVKILESNSQVLKGVPLYFTKL